jgi:hypothetical protein
MIDAKYCKYCNENYCSKHMRLHKQHAYHIVNRTSKGVRPEDDEM